MVDVISFMGRKNLFLRRRRVRNRFCATTSLVRNLSNHFRRPMLNLNSFLGTDPANKLVYWQPLRSFSVRQQYCHFEYSVIFENVILKNATFNIHNLLHSVIFNMCYFYTIILIWIRF